MTILDSLASWGGWFAAVAAGMAGLGWLAKKAFRLASLIDDVHDLVTTELRTNGGTSIKDAVKRIPALEKEIHVHNAKTDQRLDALEAHIIRGEN